MDPKAERFATARGVSPAARKEWRRLPIRVQEAIVRCGRGDALLWKDDEALPPPTREAPRRAPRQRWEASLRATAAAGPAFVVDAKVEERAPTAARASPFAEGARVGRQWWSVRARRDARRRRTRLRTPPPPTQKRVNALRQVLLAEQHRHGPAHDYRRLKENVE